MTLEATYLFVPSRIRSPESKRGDQASCSANEWVLIQAALPPKPVLTIPLLPCLQLCSARTDQREPGWAFQGSVLAKRDPASLVFWWTIFMLSLPFEKVNIVGGHLSFTSFSLLSPELWNSSSFPIAISLWGITYRGFWLAVMVSRCLISGNDTKLSIFACFSKTQALWV